MLCHSSLSLSSAELDGVRGGAGGAFFFEEQHDDVFAGVLLTGDAVVEAVLLCWNCRSAKLIGVYVLD